MTPEAILKAGFDATLAKAITDAYKVIEQQFVLKKWKPSELDAGHFVEAVRRALDLELTGSYLPLTRSLPRFDDKALKQYEQHSGHESYRILLPRALKAVYSVRNKRGVAHISNVSPNEMDATLIMYTVKWVLAELVRLKSGLPPDETQKLIDSIVEEQCPLIWKDGDITTILIPRMKAREQLLVLLYDRSPIPDTELQQAIEYSSRSAFRSIVRKLHKQKLLYYHDDGNCRLSPVGVLAAEHVISKHRYASNK